MANAFAGTVTTLSGFDNGFDAVEIASHALPMPFPSEPAVTPDNRYLVTHHPRPPINGIPDTAVSLLDMADGYAASGPPLVGEGRAWVQVKQSTLSAFAPGLADRIRALVPNGADQGELLDAIDRVVAAGQSGDLAGAMDEIVAMQAVVDGLAGVIGPSAAAVLTGGLALALSSSAPCQEDETTLCLGAEGRFRTRLDWQMSPDDGSMLGAGTVVSLEGGLFGFENRSRPEVLVKLVDGCAVNGAHWVFVGPTTTRPFDLTIEDTWTGNVRRFSHGGQGLAESTADLEAFATCF